MSIRARYYSRAEGSTDVQELTWHKYHQIASEHGVTLFVPANFRIGDVNYWFEYFVDPPTPEELEEARANWEAVYNDLGNNLPKIILDDHPAPLINWSRLEKPGNIIPEDQWPPDDDGVTIPPNRNVSQGIAQWISASWENGYPRAMVDGYQLQPDGSFKPPDNFIPITPASRWRSYRCQVAEWVYRVIAGRDR